MLLRVRKEKEESGGTLAFDLKARIPMYCAQEHLDEDPRRVGFRGKTGLLNNSYYFT